MKIIRIIYIGENLEARKIAFRLIASLISGEEKIRGEEVLREAANAPDLETANEKGWLWPESKEIIQIILCELTTNPVGITRFKFDGPNPPTLH